MDRKIGENIRALRKLNDLSQQKLADKLGISAQIVSNWERNCNSPSLQDTEKLAKIFSCTIDYLVNNETFYEMNCYLNQIKDKELRNYWYKELVRCKDSELKALQTLWETMKSVAVAQ
ncbi:helix-turn-helix domain-containing protein [Rummeliibacillus stabekisii]|uniref:helix-turn-helix domain-containing protein n=1 Tax=Rummeliibacillus stabekisii TaxID=241244 RepID=UPI00203DA6A8|nr:helix-turn-helix transcriptional regulator [Rummeliibacillus stabekisii]MCM3318061.1 helix-turn-helix domain-containing protein [Rummeliibacillus stabekisii]